MADNRGRMERADRAKQFMPFDALKGYREALRERERIEAPKRDLSEDYMEELDRKFHQIKKNDIVTVEYFRKNEFVQITGMVSGIDENVKLLKVADANIPFKDICDLHRYEK